MRSGKIEIEEEASPRKFVDVARLPKPNDNVAIAIDVLKEGTLVERLD